LLGTCPACKKQVAIDGQAGKGDCRNCQHQVLLDETRTYEVDLSSPLFAESKVFRGDDALQQCRQSIWRINTKSDKSEYLDLGAVADYAMNLMSEAGIGKFHRPAADSVAVLTTCSVGQDVLLMVCSNVIYERGDHGTSKFAGSAADLEFQVAFREILALLATKQLLFDSEMLMATLANHPFYSTYANRMHMLSMPGLKVHPIPFGYLLK